MSDDEKKPTKPAPRRNSVSRAADPTEEAAVMAKQPVAVEQIIAREPVKEPTAVVGEGDTDSVSLRNINYKDLAHRKSLSVHHVQRRLNELGYPEAYADRDGFYGDLTRDAVARFQKDRGLTETGIVDADTLAALFDGDPNVSIAA